MYVIRKCHLSHEFEGQMTYLNKALKIQFFFFARQRTPASSQRFQIPASGVRGRATIDKESRPEEDSCSNAKKNQGTEHFISPEPEHFISPAATPTFKLNAGNMNCDGRISRSSYLGFHTQHTYGSPLPANGDSVRRRCSVLQWHPDFATQLIVASDDDSSPSLRQLSSDNTKSSESHLIHPFLQAYLDQHLQLPISQESEYTKVLESVYIYDTINEIDNRMRFYDSSKGGSLNQDFVSKIADLLPSINEYARLFKTSKELSESMNLEDFSIRLYNNVPYRTSLPPQLGTLGGIVFGDEINANEYDIVVQSRDEYPKRVGKMHPSYMPLQYPLLFPYGESG
ncbi:hypothetical protein LXL04_028465 [Taraxacum kok-saghyz]